MMNTTHRRIALLTGASAAALGMALPAQAQVRPAARPSDTMADGIYPGAATAANTVEICDLDTPPADPCFFGVIDTNTPAATAIVNTIGTGQVRQDPAGAVGLMTNNQLAEHGAIAVATGVGAVALAQAFTLVGQTDLAGLGDVDLTIDNNGTWIFDAVADAEAATGVANADALLDIGLRQQGTGDTVSLAIVNDGDMYFLATANAVGAAGANATATVDSAIVQMGTGNAVTLSLVNNGTMVVAADANATATTGPAVANASADGVRQQAVGATFAAATYDNNGLFVVTADAEAIALAGFADASASVSYAISQQVDVLGTGTALAAVTNDGTMTVGAYAFASGTAGASADASVDQVIIQDVSVAGDGFASAAMNNNNVLNVSAIATAVATAGSADASASISEVINQNVFIGGTGTGVASVVNAGTINVIASASAVGPDGFVNDASASVSGLVEQDVFVGFGTASAIISNTADAVINVSANANAVGGNANASASVSEILEQDVDTGGNGAAIASINNAGVISIAAVAAGSGTVSPDADVEFDDLIEQDANGGVDGTASARITNDGSITITGNADAVGTTGFVTASASGSDLISQFAQATEGAGAEVAVATASLVNGTAGVIDVSLAAIAINTGTGASAYATLDGVIEQQAVGNLGADAGVNLDNAGVIEVDLIANASATSFAYASAAFTGPVIEQDATAAATGGTAVAAIDNSGSIDINATASAIATQGTATAFAGMTGGDFAIEQRAVAGDTAVVSFTNTGSVNLGAAAVADGHDVAATAIMNGLLQEGTGAIVSQTFANGDGAGGATFAVAASASANGSTASAFASAAGVVQVAIATTSAIQVASNSGLLSVSADAFADGVDVATAYATAGPGMEQVGIAPFVSQSMVNSGTVALAANATATAGQIGVAEASAYAFFGMAQIAVADTTALQFMSNATGGVVSLAATANAIGAGFASASAGAYSAMWQLAIADNVTQTMVNNGTVTATANANAVANGTIVATTGEEQNVGTAVANASAYGMGQIGVGMNVSQTMTNTGTLNVGAHATASAPAEDMADGTPPGGGAFADAQATGAYQIAVGTVAQTIAFTNGGEINVNAAATAVGTTGTASATAIGYNGFGAGGVTLTATIVNTGTMNVSATAIAPGTAFALAQGIILENDPTPVFAGTPTPVFVGDAPNPINGTITNDGVINVTAFASGGVASTATATGISILGGVNNMVVTNTGLISVDAIVANGGDATATGVLVGTNGTIAPAPLATDVFTFTNDGGTIIVRESVDGGATWRRGTAIDVSGAPNASVINLLGDGTIYGNIDINEGDNIFVEDGDTYFDGIVNPECHEDYGGPGPAFDDPAVNACGQGTLTIQNGGNLILADSPFGGDETMYDGPSYVFVDTFNVAADGTITFQLTPETAGVQPLGTYPQVFADVANLDGTLVADIEVAGGLFANSYFYNNVIDAVVRNGTFDQCIIAGDLGNSALIDLECIYDGQANVDLGITRTAFNAVEGLTRNQRSVAGGIECIYGDVGPAGLIGTPLGGTIAQLFLFDGTEYPQALDQLSGAGYAGYLQSFNSLGYHYNQILARATDCEIPALAGSALACRVAPIHLWGQVDYDTLKQDGDQELGDYDADRWSFLVGLDFAVTPAAVIGGSIGKVNNKVDYEETNTRIKGKGWQFGLYGTYDPGAFYVKALGTYTRMDGDARRDIDFVPFGGTLAGTIDGDPDTRMWTVGLHGGMRLPMGQTAVITPFLNYDYTNVKLKSFDEDGLAGANLRINGGRERHSWLTGGVKVAGQMGGLVPEAMLGYRYMFGDRRSSFNANFAGFEECDFDIVSMTEKRGSILAGLSVGGLLGGVDVRLGYLGAFNENAREHSGFLKLVVPLGAVAAPPPPPVVVAPPPPPPPATQTCPDGSVILATDICPAPPPPPPPPLPAPERG